MTSLREAEPLARIDYLPLLEAIHGALRTTPLWQYNPKEQRLILKADTVAQQVAQTRAASTHCILDGGKQVSRCSVNYADEVAFKEQIRSLARLVKEQLDHSAKPDEILGISKK